MILSVLLLSALSLMVQAESPPPAGPVIPLDQLLSSREMAKFNREERYHSKLEILRKAIERRSDRLPGQIEKRDLAVIFKTLAEVRGLVSSAMEISVRETDKDERRHKEVKKLEIELRKLSIDLPDMALAVPLEDRTQFQETIQVLEDLRNQLLRQLFGKAIGAAASNVPFSATVGFSAVRAGTTANANQRSIQGLWDIDRFTESEFGRLQVAQKLVKRVEVFLDIAEQRLDEIDRRRNGTGWDQEEPNPLEFYTYQEMLHAYDRAMEGIMSNIDLKARDGSTSVKDTRKALEKLQEKATTFQARLEAIQPFIREQRERDLLDSYDRAVKSTSVAVQGARYGIEKLKDKD